MKASEYRAKANEYLERIVNKRAHLFTAADLIWLTGFINAPDPSPILGLVETAAIANERETRLDSLRRLEEQILQRERDAA